VAVLKKTFFKKFTKLVFALVFLWLIFYLLGAFGIVEDKMRKYIPEELNVQRRIKVAKSAAMFGGYANISVYKLSPESRKFIQNNPTYLSGWDNDSVSCNWAIVFLRDIGRGKDKKIKPYIRFKEKAYNRTKVFSRNNVILVPERDLILTCQVEF